MQLTMGSTSAGSAVQPRQAAVQPRIAGSSIKVAPIRRRTATVAQVSPSTVEAIQTASHLVSAAIIAAGGVWWLQRELQLEQDRTQSFTKEACPTCHGSGYEPCACTRWSDGDTGCRSCNRSGFMKCRSCGGGGTAVPIKVTVRKTDGMQ